MTPRSASKTPSKSPRSSARGSLRTADGSPSARRHLRSREDAERPASKQSARGPAEPERKPEAPYDGPMQVRPRLSQLLQLRGPEDEEPVEEATPMSPTSAASPAHAVSLPTASRGGPLALKLPQDIWKEMGHKSRLAPATLDRDFGKTCSHYRLANWGNREFYLPSIASENRPPIADRLRERVEACDLAQVKLLLHAGVPPDLFGVAPRRFGGGTALHFAAHRGDELMCQLLLSFRANPELPDNTPASAESPGRRTPIDIARRASHTHLVHLFNAHLIRVKAKCTIEPADLGPGGMPPPAPHPVRLRLNAVEPGFMD